MGADSGAAAPRRKGICFPSPSLWEEMIEHARRAAPEEACGILAGRQTREGREVAKVFACRNAHPGDRRRRFLIDAEEQLAAQREAREAGLEIVGYYHSHPNGLAEMSEEDRRQAHPRVSNVILAFRQGEFAGARSWRMRGDGVAEEEPLRAPRVTG
jgi:proteasome lid subunit RPN8/RPN11